MSKGRGKLKSTPRTVAKSERLGAALRENLKRRKAQARAGKIADQTDEDDKTQRGQ